MMTNGDTEDGRENAPIMPGADTVLAMLAALGVSVPDEALAGIETNLAVIAGHAARVMEADLPLDTLPAPVFLP